VSGLAGLAARGSRPRWRHAVVAVGAVLLCVGLAGCGGSMAPSVANLGTTASTVGAAVTSPSTTSPRPSSGALIECFDAHGFQAAAASAGGSGTKSLNIAGVTIGGNVDPSSPQFQSALQACRKYLPGGGPPTLTPAQQAEAAKAMLRFATCMRADGVPSFPDPNGEGRFPLNSMNQLDPNSPLVQSAFKACESLEPKIGPRIAF
jgi:hypothetical protein